MLIFLIKLLKCILLQQGEQNLAQKYKKLNLYVPGYMLKKIADTPYIHWVIVR